jgi:hypothetical protein
VNKQQVIDEIRSRDADTNMLDNTQINRDLLLDEIEERDDYVVYWMGEGSKRFRIKNTAGEVLYRQTFNAKVV